MIVSAAVPKAEADEVAATALMVAAPEKSKAAKPKKNETQK